MISKADWHFFWSVTAFVSAGLFVLASLVAVQHRTPSFRAAVKTESPAEISAVARTVGLDADFAALVDGCLLPIAAVYGYDLRVSSGFRSLEEQDKLYQQGRTENGHIVTEVPAGLSVHNYGLAVDLVDRWRGYDIDWERLGRIGAYCGLEQNGDGDLPHFEYREGLSIWQLFDGERPPRPVFPCRLLADLHFIDWKLTLEDLRACGAPDF